ncbi:hypothetical protein NNO04_12595 [Citrobacter sp. Awk 4]|uniref:hypothetical protein n=1 Tax=Citrobacter sp. Awk 4 TaxID=2963955 RepID=UPI002304393F|nr:hypothetical protein [Citrobacter sp. Awk 4]MDA8479539.1 hypothetical protein [Citrobacter sp. Awk 4]
MRLFISGILLLSAQCANAANSCDIHAIVQHAWPEAKPAAEGTMITPGNQVIDITGNSPQSAICRVWPAHPELTLAAVPLMSQEKIDYGHNGDLELLVLNSVTQEVNQRLHLPERMSDDAIRITGIALDTARWKVAPSQTAFGLHITRSGSSRVNPIGEDALSLYVIENNQLRRVLEGIALTANSGEWDGNCAGEFNDIKRILAIDASSHKGYADIRVNEKSVASTAFIDSSGECTAKDTPARASWVLRYDGTQYAVPKELAPLE